MDNQNKAIYKKPTVEVIPMEHLCYSDTSDYADYGGAKEMVFDDELSLSDDDDDEVIDISFTVW